MYDLPLLTQFTPLLRLTLGGWQVSSLLRASSGEPLQITESSSLQGSRPDYIGGNPVLDNSRATLQYLNPASFARVPIIAASGATARPGNAGNNSFRAPGLWNVDFSLGKNFYIREQRQLQFRVDSFNFFNHTNFIGLSANINSPTFGRFTSTRGARIIQLNARLTF